MIAAACERCGDGAQQYCAGCMTDMHHDVLRLETALAVLMAAVVEHRERHPDLTSNADLRLWRKAGLRP